MRITVDRSKCIGTGLCESVAPDLFEVGGDGEVVVASGDVPEERREDVEQAVESCPTLALGVEG